MLKLDTGKKILFCTFGWWNNTNLQPILKVELAKQAHVEEVYCTVFFELMES